MFNTIIITVLFILSISIILSSIRVFIGPTLSDRIVALDTIGLLLISFVAMLMMVQDTNAYTDVIIVVAIIAFVGSVSIALFLERGDLFERD
ncbi:Na(+)/H(+) antiporter subunit F1 [Alkalihalobacillus pseudalcaliphilus]|uniref:Na(+)/H(+) antiporter subunit F1 n=1 Tax=Alkalihalobacillus pseudalcaliphilus TaxID=79884 RepID=UPI00064D9E35|nr:Na(+)/H(+) antiporter subunit F1 [Alkalihalobacillus pseudalcaliphilus]KMK77201.1 cation:proton antiporter [Alkalihalobacillus pseudalcaliphilus]